MQTAALRALEFDRIVEAVRALCADADGRRAPRRAGAVRPIRTASRSCSRRRPRPRSTSRSTARFALRATDDLPPILGALAVEGRALEAPRLLALADFLDSVEDTRAAIRRVARFVPAARTGQPPAPRRSRARSRRSRDKIDPSGDVVDDASPELRSIRDRLRKQRTRLRGTLESYLRGKDTAKYLQEQVVTERNGRYVLVVRAEHRSGIPGIVHGASASGASLFLEPLSTVEINNDIVALEEQEAEEVRRILLALTDAFRARPLDLQRTVEAATELDVLQARARFSQSVDGVEPRLVDRRRVRAAGGARIRCVQGTPVPGDDQDRVRRPPTLLDHRARTPAARPWRSRRRGCSR